ncbi:hypothetical protein BLNAU_10697 [Blattamonas nauphoetae]|uniref:Uncharacterized protein n=1 Tax=Blattamonas nauphoetae TaxID=2049346 RepID=A0ABQ9XRN2_9EUKA|nr:hypothetical protein BLNAU_10697 [Blattamonas nauphoetae]
MEQSKNDTSLLPRMFYFVDYVNGVVLSMLNSDPPIEVDSDIVIALMKLEKDTLSTVLANIPILKDIVSSLQPANPPPLQPTSETSLPQSDEKKVDQEPTDPAESLLFWMANFIGTCWEYYERLVRSFPSPHQSSFQTVILDDPSFTDNFLESLKLATSLGTEICLRTFTRILNMPFVKERFTSGDLVRKMFETVDFVSLPLSMSAIHYRVTSLLETMMDPVRGDIEALFKQYPQLRVSVFEPARRYIHFVFHNLHRFTLNAEYRRAFDDAVCRIHNDIKNMELRSDEHDAVFVSELVRWEVRTMVEKENEESLKIVFQSMLNRGYRWKQDKPERQKRREVLLREEGWDDTLELRVVGIEVDTNQEMLGKAAAFRSVSSFNADEW